MQEVLGLIGSLCFAFGSWPQAYYSWKTKSAKGLSGLFSVCGYQVHFLYYICDILSKIHTFAKLHFRRFGCTGCFIYTYHGMYQ